MIKKALNNPLVVGVLVLCALAFVLRDFIHFSSSKPPQARTVVAPPVVAPQPAAPVKTAPPPKRAAAPARQQLTHSDWKRVAMIPLARRDPFRSVAPRVVAASAPRHSDGDGAAPDDGLIAPGLRLRAIVAGSDLHYAAINGKLMQIGDVIDGWKLVAIGVNRVQMRGKEGLLTLDIDGGARMGGRVLATAERKQPAATPPQRGAASAAGSSIPNSVGDLNMYQGLFDSLIKSGVIPTMPALK